MVLALEKIACYKHYISVILKAMWHFTAELNEIVPGSALTHHNIWVEIAQVHSLDGWIFNPL